MNPKRSNRTLKHIIFICSIITALILSNVIYTMITRTHLRTGTAVLKYGSENEKSRALTASRGYIFDRSGEIIAQDETTYTMYAILNSSHLGIGGTAEYVMDPKMTAEKIAPILKLEVDDVLGSLEKAMASGRYQTEFGLAGKSLSTTQKEAIDALELPGISFTKSSQRYYPTGKFASNLIGFAQYDETEKRIVGKMGLEAYMDEHLKGVDGEERYQSTALGTSIPGSKHVISNAQNGNDVYLTIDKNVQVALEKTMEDTMEAFDSQRAWGIIMEVETGRILGYSAYPTFDLNKRDIEEYVDVPSQKIYEPGSVMKAITYAAAIDSGNYPANKTFESGAFHMGIDANGNATRVSSNGESVIKDALGKDYGVITFEEGFARSSNIAICDMLTKYFPTDIFSDYLDRFGFFKKVGMEGVQEGTGTKVFNYPIEKLTTGFGQGSTVTAMQMVQAFSALFNDGKMVKPYYIDKVLNSYTKDVVDENTTEVVGEPISKETSQQIISLMDDVVNKEHGTGFYRFHMDDVEVIGKTGTGELIENGKYSTSMYTNSFMGAAPADDPKIMMYYAFESADIKYSEGDYFKSAFRSALIAEGISGMSVEQNTTNTSWQEYEMPSLINHSLNYVSEKTKSMNFNQVIIGDGSSIIKQYPEAGATAITKQNVFLLSDGANITMPNMSGWSRKDVLRFSEITGIVIGIEGSGNVSEQSVPEGETITNGQEINIILK